MRLAPPTNPIPFYSEAVEEELGKQNMQLDPAVSSRQANRFRFCIRQGN
jgi:hypothetical protein